MRSLIRCQQALRACRLEAVHYAEYDCQHEEDNCCHERTSKWKMQYIESERVLNWKAKREAMLDRMDSTRD